MRWSFSVLRRHEPFLQKAKKNKPDNKGTRRRAIWYHYDVSLNFMKKDERNPSWIRESNSPKKLEISQYSPGSAASDLTSRTANKARRSLLHSQVVSPIRIRLLMCVVVLTKKGSVVDPVPELQVNPDPEFWWPKIGEKKYSWSFFLSFLI